MNRPRTIKYKPHMLHVHVCRVEDGVRLWRSDNPGDVFDVFTIEEFEALKTRYPLPLIEGFPEADDGTLECNLCIHNKTEEL